MEPLDPTRIAQRRRFAYPLLLLQFLQYPHRDTLATQNDAVLSLAYISSAYWLRLAIRQGRDPSMTIMLARFFDQFWAIVSPEQCPLNLIQWQRRDHPSDAIDFIISAASNKPNRQNHEPPLPRRLVVGNLVGRCRAAKASFDLGIWIRDDHRKEPFVELSHGLQNS